LTIPVCSARDGLVRAHPIDRTGAAFSGRSLPRTTNTIVTGRGVIGARSCIRGVRRIVIGLVATVVIDARAVVANVAIRHGDVVIVRGR
jgi:hypothetical protein